MAKETREPVRPTIRALTEDLNLALPTVDEPLPELDHPLIDRAQLIPLVSAAGGSERIVSLTDRAWLKVKTSRQRGGATCVDPRGAVDLALSQYDPEWLEGWWLGFGGRRKEGAADDVYAAVLARSTAASAGRPATVDTRWLLPTARDVRRAIAEFAAREERAMRDQVLATIVESAVSGKPITTQYGHHALTVLVRVPDNLTYLAVGLVGVRNDREIAALLACVPGVEASSWGTEPGGVLGLAPRPGQLIYSTALEPEVLSELMELYPPGTLRIE